MSNEVTFDDSLIESIKVNLGALPDTDLGELLDACNNEYQRRRALTVALEASPELAVAAQVVAGHEPGGPWKQPLGAFDAYPQDWEVEHEGKRWVSLIPANVYEPGVSGWREITEDGSPAEWVQPLGAHDAYMKGDRVAHDGVVWVSTLDHNVYVPGEYGWDKQEEDE